jgi:predicted component of type VI protein secretion system
MAELGFQVSTKTPDGTIFVIADASYQGFANKLNEALDAQGAEHLLQAMAAAFASAPASQPMTTNQIAQSFNAQVITPPADAWGTPPPAAYPAPVAAAPTGGPVCKHGEGAKLVPAGISKTTQKPYRAFYACSRPQGQQCDFRANAS